MSGDAPRVGPDLALLRGVCGQEVAFGFFVQQHFPRGSERAKAPLIAGPSSFYSNSSLCVSSA